MTKPDEKTTTEKEIKDLAKPIIAPTNPERYYPTKDKPAPPLHRQARGYLKTAGAIVGRDMEQTLFTLPTYEKDINPYKYNFSKMTGLTGNLLIMLWQKNKDENDIYTIKNLTAMAETLGATPQELKLYLVYLGGYQYPIHKPYVKPNGKKGISIYSDKLFYIKFNILYQDGENEKNFTNDDRIGTNYVSFIKGRDIDSVEIMPSKSIQEDLRQYNKGQSTGLGNVLVDDAFVAFGLDLSDLAYKIFCYSGSNKPSFKIGFDKLITKINLNLEKQVKAQGKPRVLNKIREALKELLDKGHLAKWDYYEAGDTFSWTYSNKIIKHKELLLTGKRGADETRQDTTTP